MDNLPIEVIFNILSFIDIRFLKKVKYTYPKSELSEETKRFFISKIIYYPPIISGISRSWRTAILLSQCKICKKGKYDFNKRICNCCNHVMENLETKNTRINSKRIKLMTEKVNNYIINKGLNMKYVDVNLRLSIQ